MGAPRLTLAPALSPPPPPSERQDALQAVAALCEAAPGARRPAAREALGPLFLRLIAAAGPQERRRLAERLAPSDWAPPAVLLALALDTVDVARSVIAAARALADDDLISVIGRGTPEHRIAVAARPGLSPEVADAVLATGEPAALEALAANAATPLRREAMVRLVEASRTLAALRAPLARRPELCAEMARRLHGWVGETLREALAARFGLDRAALGPQATTAAGSEIARDRPAVATDESEARLIAKLQASGQLRPGWLLRVLRDGKLSLFEAGLATLAGLSRQSVHAALRAPDPGPLSRACAEVGIDRSAFPTLLSLVRSLNDDLPGEGRL